MKVAINEKSIKHLVDSDCVDMVVRYIRELEANNADLRAEVERLTKAGNAMDNAIGLPISAVQEFELHQAWFAAKGGQS